MGSHACAPRGDSRGRAGVGAPVVVTRGRYPQGSLQELHGVDRFSDRFPVHPHD